MLYSDWLCSQLTSHLDRLALFLDDINPLPRARGVCSAIQRTRRRHEQVKSLETERLPFNCSHIYTSLDNMPLLLDNSVCIQCAATEESEREDREREVKEEEAAESLL
jgi:hypothetical protein